MSLYSRKDWISNSLFHPLSNREVLEKVEKLVENHPTTPDKDKKPVVVFDLDSTLYEVSHRTLAIIKEWNQDPKTQLAVQPALDSIAIHHIGYSLADLAQNLGLPVDHPDTQHALTHLKPFWWDRFFSNDYLPHDKPYPGAVEFVRKLSSLGAHIIYLTGREHKKMYRVTVDNLQRDNFPWAENTTTLIMKPNASIIDSEHKRNVKSVIDHKSKLLASFENEPVNIVALAQTFPDSMHIFMDSIYSDHPSIPGKELFRIDSFLKS